MAQKKNEKAISDFRSIIGWTSSLFTQRNNNFIESLESIMKEMKIDPYDQIITQTGDVIVKVAEKIANESQQKEKFSKEFKENFFQRFIDIISESAQKT